MENTEEKQDDSGPAFALGWLIAPLAILLSFATSQALGLEFLTAEAGMTYGVLCAAAILATVPRYIGTAGLFEMRSSVLSLAFLGICLVIAWTLASFTSVGALTALLFLLLAIGGHLFDIRGRHEEQTILTFAIIGFMFALLVAGATDVWAAEEQDLINNNPNDQIQDGTPGADEWSEYYLNEHRQATGFLFFSVWTISVLIGVVVAAAQRGVLFAPGSGKWWSFLPTREGYKPNSSEWTLMAVFGTWALAHLAGLIHFATGDVATRLELSIGGVEHGHITYWWSAITGIILLFIGFCIAERWFTRAMLIAACWIMYTIGGWQEAGWMQVEMLEGTQGLFIWLGISFFVFVGVFYIAGHDKWGGWDNRSLVDPSNARQWWQAHWAGVLTMSAFIVALIVRTTWNIIPAMAATGTLGWDMTGGSDPWYMKRAVDYIIAQHAHFIFDADRAYPIGGINPRPPLFAWSLALGGMLTAPFLGLEASEAVWWSVAGLPALYGALTVFPLAALARDQIGKGAGVITAWLIALMPGHVSHSTFALADHDAFVLLFLSLGFHYYLKAVQHGGNERLVKEISWRPRHIFAAMGSVVNQKKTAVGYAVLAGMAISTVALGWKGFVYGPAIIFAAFSLQILLNLIRRRDSTILATLNIIMLSVVFLVPMPFYAHPQLNLVWDASGFQPMFYIFGFTLLASFIVMAYRDKPWLLVFGTGVAMIAAVLSILAVLQFVFNVYNGWDVLFTGGYYFTKNKIFGTIAEAQAPSRGTLFASFGPLVFIAALSAGAWGVWQGIRHRRQTRLILGLWVLIGAYMAWSAGRFIFNASPAMAVLASWAIVGVWQGSGAAEFTKEWRRLGIRTPGERFTATRKALWRTPAFSALGLVMLMLMSQHATYGLDAGIPRGSDAKEDIDSTIYHLSPDMFRFDIWDFSLLDNTPYKDGDSWYMNSFGPGFNGWGWNTAYDWLASQDLTLDADNKDECNELEGIWRDGVCAQRFGDRPAFVSWWDYGFQALAQGQHPSVSDNFQSGIPATGNMLLSRSQDDLVALFIWQLTEGDMMYSTTSGAGYELTSPFYRVLDNALDDDQLEEFIHIQTEMGPDGAKDRTFTVVESNGQLVLAKGGEVVDGVLNESQGNLWRIYDGVDVESCDDESVNTCKGESYVSEEQARVRFNQKTVNDDLTETETTYYIIGEYWYTTDLIEEFDNVASNLHRKNARLALTRQLLTDALDTEELNSLYSNLMALDIYDVPDSEGAPGETFRRNHEIRYFAVDNRLYPIGGRYDQDRAYNYGNPTGIFHAPTSLGGQDVDTFLKTTYETERDGIDEEMTAERYEEAYLQDLLNQQQQGAEYVPLNLVDIRVDHKPAFFDTMLARTYVGYGASTLGLDVGSSNPQPAQHFQTRGSPGTMLQQAVPLPGAMLNHFVIANWYGGGLSDEAGFPEEFAGTRPLAYTNTQVKVLKYYSGTEICGKVEMSDDGQGMNNTRILLERDAFSGEHEADMDNNTYWIPIAAVDTDENGEYCVVAPAGHLRLSAYLGDFSSVGDEDLIRQGKMQEKITDLVTQNNEDRDTNPLTGILGGVSNMTWLNEVHLNVTGEQGHSGEKYGEEIDILVDTSGVSGVVSWTGNEFFEGDPLVNTDFILRNIWSTEDNYTITTTNGSFTTSETRIVGPGHGEVTFTEPGTFTPSFADDATTTVVKNFRGNYTRTIGHGLTFTGDGSWTGKGSLRAYADNLENTSVEACAGDLNESAAYAQTDWQICLFEEGTTGELNTYLFNGSINASGRMTANGSVSFTTYLDGETFEGVGSFEGTGTINGTGTFTGIGHFSGPIVEPGSFYISGLTPGTYNMIAQLENGKEVLLPQPVEVKIEPQFDLKLTMPGSLFTDTMEDMNGDTFTNRTFELIDVDLGVDAAIVIETNETGGFKHGPLSKGEYYYRFDLDGDGWYELNSTLTVGDESEELNINMPIPIHTDVWFNISSDSLDEEGQPIAWEASNRTMIVESKFGDFPPFEVTSNETGYVRFESPMGHWIVSDMSNDTHMLWFDFELKEDDLELGDQTYIVAVNVSGQVVSPDDWAAWNENRSMEHNFITVSGVNVTMRSGNLVRYDVTDANGVFTARLPAGADFSMTTISPQKVSTASRQVTVNGAGDYSWDIENNTFGADFVNLTMEPSDARTGQLKIFDNDTLWDEFVPGWQSAEVVATNNESGVSWSAQSSTSGDFEFFLPYGNFTVQVLNDDLAIEEQYFNVSDDGESLEWSMLGTPDLTMVDIQVFLDDLGDGLYENGTPVSVNLTFTPVSSHGEIVNVTSSNVIWDEGNFTLEIEAGEYQVTIASQNISNESSRKQYQTTRSCTVTGSPEPCFNLMVPLTDVEDPFLIAMEPEWLLTAQVMNGSSGLENTSITFYGDGDFFDVETNETGHIAAYIPIGDWNVVLHQVQKGDYFLEMQQTVSITSDSDRTDLVWQTVSSTNVSIHLSEADTDVNLSGYTITAVSKDGLRNVSIGPTDGSGNATGTLVTGEWTFFLNRSTTTDRWLIEEDEYQLDVELSDAAGQKNLTMQAKKTTLIGGMIFWDLDGNGIQNNHEGIPDVHVEIVSENLSINLTTDADGVWEVFAPILTNYTINVSKEGFSSASYEDGYLVNQTHVSEDLALTAGNVSVSGTVSHLLSDISVLENTTVTLYPVVGRELDSVVANIILNGTVIEWDANVTPGDWVVWAELSNAGEDDYSVAIGMMTANVSDGGTLELEMRNGGWVSMLGKWNDFQIQEHHIGESDVSGAPMNGSAVVELDLDDGKKIELPTSSDGTYQLLLPTGRATFSVSFSTTEMGMEMNYSGGVTIDVITGVTQEEKTMTATRPARHDVTFELISVVSGGNNVDIEDKTMTAIEVAGGDDELDSYQDIIVEAKVTYSGNQAESLYTLTGDTGILHDSQDWNVTFLVDESAEEWNSSHTIALGLGENLSALGVKEQTFRFKIQLPTQDIARSYDDNHSIGVEFKVGAILTGELGLEVHVPQRHEIRLDSYPEQVGVAPGGTTGTPIDIDLTNLGNGEDTVQFELDASTLPENWSATPTSASLVLSSTQTRTQSFTIYAPLDAGDGTYVVKVNALDESGAQFVDEDGKAIDEIEITVSIARANIKIVQFLNEGEALFQDTNTFTVKVKNEGTLDAEQVDVSIEVSGLQDIDPAPSATTTISVPAGETVTAELQLDLSTADLAQIQLSAYATTTVQTVEGGDQSSETITRNVVAPTPDEPNSWLPWIIISVILLGIYAGVKGLAARRGPKF
jgi:asparagine N-glycosylation enzyme membrane subunit Stt3